MKQSTVMERVTEGVPKRVCRANGCYQLIAGALPGEGRGTSAYCSNACRVKAHRRGKADTAIQKVEHLHHQAEGVAIKMRALESRLLELQHEHTDICKALEVAHSENLEERKEMYLNV